MNGQNVAAPTEVGWRLGIIFTFNTDFAGGGFVFAKKCRTTVTCPRCSRPRTAAIWRYHGRISSHEVYLTTCRRCLRRCELFEREVPVLLNGGQVDPGLSWKERNESAIGQRRKAP